MTAISQVMLLLALLPGRWKIGYQFGIGMPSMADEEAYSRVLQQGAVSEYELDEASGRLGFEVIGDLSERLRFKGALGWSFYGGEYSEGGGSFELLFTHWFLLGLGALLSDSGEEVVWVDNAATELDALVYYSMPGADWLSAGGGPVYTWVSRSVNTPYSSVEGSGSGPGFHAGLRVDQLSDRTLGLPLVFGGEFGYRHQKIELDSEETGGFTVDYSGPVFSLGTYIRL